VATCGALVLLSLFAACNRGGEQTADAKTPPRTTGATSSVSADTLVAKTGVGAGRITIPGAEPEDGQWLRPAKDYASTRYSGLDQINTTNASRLGLAWSFSTGVLRGQEAAPLVVGNTMYVVTPYPNIP
jgi:glucose dehydrogenase